MNFCDSEKGLLVNGHIRSVDLTNSSTKEGIPARFVISNLTDEALSFPYFCTNSSSLSCRLPTPIT